PTTVAESEPAAVGRQPEEIPLPRDIPHWASVPSRQRCTRTSTREGSPMWKDFKAFIMRGNVVDLAVAVVIGAAFGAIVKSVVDDIIMPPIGLLVGRLDFSSLMLVLKDGTTGCTFNTPAGAKTCGAVTLNYGSFINNIIAFLIVAAAVFMMVRIMNKMYA